MRAMAMPEPQIERGDNVPASNKMLCASHSIRRCSAGNLIQLGEAL